MKKMLAILALCVSACDSIEFSKKEPNLNVDSTTNIQRVDSITSVLQKMNDTITAK